VCPFNSSLKDTSVDEILVVSVGYFQFLIKGYPNLQTTHKRNNNKLSIPH